MCWHLPLAVILHRFNRAETSQVIREMKTCVISYKVLLSDCVSIPVLCGRFKPFQLFLLLQVGWYKCLGLVADMSLFNTTLHNDIEVVPPPLHAIHT